MSQQKRGSFFRGLFIFAIAILFHAAYSVAEWRSLTRTSDGLPIPLDIQIQTLIGLFLSMACVLEIAGDFREIRAYVELSNKSFETVSNRPSFYVYSHRGKALKFLQDGRRSLMEIPEQFLS